MGAAAWDGGWGMGASAWAGRRGAGKAAGRSCSCSGAATRARPPSLHPSTALAVAVQGRHRHTWTHMDCVGALAAAAARDRHVSRRRCSGAATRGGGPKRSPPTRVLRGGPKRRPRASARCRRRRSTAGVKATGAMTLPLYAKPPTPSCRPASPVSRPLRWAAPVVGAACHHAGRQPALRWSRPAPGCLPPWCRAPQLLTSLLVSMVPPWCPRRPVRRCWRRAREGPVSHARLLVSASFRGPAWEGPVSPRRGPRALRRRTIRRTMRAALLGHDCVLAPSDTASAHQ